MFFFNQLLIFTISVYGQNDPSGPDTAIPSQVADPESNTVTTTTLPVAAIGRDTQLESTLEQKVIVDDDNFSVKYEDLVVSLGENKTKSIGWLANWGTQMEPKSNITYRVATGVDEYGCEEDVAQLPAETALIVRRGTCEFKIKARNAQKMRASALIVMDAQNQTREPLVMVSTENFTFPILSIPYQKKIEFSDITSIDISLYDAPIFDPADFLMVLLATFLIMAGALFSTQDLHQSQFVSSPNEVVLVDSFFAAQFVVMGSGMLMTLYFYMHYMIYFIIGLFCCCGGLNLTTIMSPLFKSIIPSTRNRIWSRKETLEDGEEVILEVCWSDAVAAIPAVATVVWFYMTRNELIGWIPQDIIGAGFLFQVQKMMRLPSIRHATILLTLLFFFDIFWVFVSPVFFKTSVMVEVAKGGNTGETVPMLLRIPTILDSIPSQRMLGFGDVALPGLLISYLLRHDIVTKKIGFSGYFLPTSIAYLCGMVITLVALKMMKMGQPALLYLVPATLGCVLFLGWKRNDLPKLWEGVEEKQIKNKNGGPRTFTLLELANWDILAAGAALDAEKKNE